MIPVLAVFVSPSLTPLLLGLSGSLHGHSVRNVTGSDRGVR